MNILNLLTVLASFAQANDSAFFIRPGERLDKLDRIVFKEGDFKEWEKRSKGKSLVDDPIRLMVIEDGIIPTRCATDPVTFGDSGIAFGSIFFYLFNDQNSGKVLLGTLESNSKPVGWVPSHCVLKNSGLFECLTDEQNGIQKKGLLIYRGEAEDLKGRAVLSNLTARLGTATDSKPGKSVRFYNILYNYKEKLDPKTNKSYFLLGFEPQIDPDPQKSDPRDVLLGWFPGEFVFPWNTREAMEYDTSSTKPNYQGPGKRRTHPARIFKNEGDAIKYAKRVKGEDEVNVSDLELVPLQEQMEGGESIPFLKNQPRYPIMNFDGSRPQDDKLGRLFKVGIIGDFITLGPDGKRTNQLTAIQMQEMKDKIAEVERDLGTTEILFVIDDTGSMREFYQNYIPKWVEDLVGKIKEGKGVRRQDVYVTVCFYRDVDDKKRKNFKGTKAEALNWLKQDAVKILPRTQVSNKNDDSSNLSSLVEGMRNHENPISGDSQEQMLFGLENGLDYANENVRSHARKLCILIGDTGSHESNLPGFNPEDQLPRIAAKLVPGNQQSPWELVAIQVPEEEPNLQKSDWSLFRKQVNEIRAAVEKQSAARNAENAKKISDSLGGKFSSSLKGTVNLFAGPKNVLDVTEKLQQEFNLREDEFAKLAKGAVDFGRGTRKATGGTAILPKLRDKLQLNGVDVDRLEKEGAQLFYEGFIWERDELGAPQIRLMLLLEEQELNSAVRSLGDVMLAMRRGKDEDKAQIAKLFTETLTGGKTISDSDLDDPDLTLMKAGLAKHGICFDSFLYRKSLGQLLKMSFNEMLFERNLAEYKKEVLRDILNKKKFSYEEKTDENAKVKGDSFGFEKVKKWYKTGDGIDDDRFFPFSRSNNERNLNYIWLSQKEEFP